MPDHTEREREARDLLSNWRPRTSADAAFWEDVDAYRAAVRAAVLAEVREKVEALTVVRDGVSPASMSYVTPAQFRERILLNLTALEATDADA